jgi:hypothetical protein
VAARISQLSSFEYMLERDGIYRKVWNNITDTSETVEFVVGAFGAIKYLAIYYLIESLVVGRLNLTESTKLTQSGLPTRGEAIVTTWIGMFVIVCASAVPYA